ncbi:Low-density lipoprotein receptor-related protein [Halotydeus destructor]|nr:Low-density lipoprotein receptor-related protein [Halotydeus destructor]
MTTITESVTGRVMKSPDGKHRSVWLLCPNPPCAHGADSYQALDQHSDEDCKFAIKDPNVTVVYQCAKLGCGFSGDILELKNHAESHEEPYSYTCFACDEIFPTEATAKHHVILALLHYTGGGRASDEYVAEKILEHRRAQRAKCISPEQVCDQVKDCPYRDDESEQLCACSCEPGYFRCKGLKAKCIPPSWQCDNVQDCPHGDDEDVSKCPPQLVHSCFPSYSGMYDGGNRKSIPLPWKCDGELDCPKGDDEKFCPIPYPRANCSEGQYNCIQSSTCIDAVSVCDRIADCRQLDDEKDCGGGNSLASLSAILEKYNFSSTAVN